MGIEDMENMRNMGPGDKTRYEFNMGGTQAEDPAEIKTFEEKRAELEREINEKKEAIREMQKEFEEYLSKINETGGIPVDIGDIGNMDARVLQKKIAELQQSLSSSDKFKKQFTNQLHALEQELSELDAAKEKLLHLGPERDEILPPPLGPERNN